MKTVLLAITLSVTLLCSPVFGADGNDWRSMSNSVKEAQISRVLSNIRARGHSVKLPPSYYVRQLDDFYSSPSSRDIEIPQALALIATAAGEKW